MITRQELHKIASTKKEEIDKLTKEYIEKKEEEINSQVDDLVKECYKIMEANAKLGKFYCEIDIKTKDDCNKSKVLNKLFVRMGEFSPKWHGDGYSEPDVLGLKWD